MKKFFIRLLSLAIFACVQTTFIMASDGNNNIAFEHKYIIDAEGYWGTDVQIDLDVYKGKYPYPLANLEPWPTEKEFLHRLVLIERHPLVEIINYRGFSPSRFELGKTVGNKEYVYKSDAKEIRWTEALRPYYIEKFHVKPSKEFYDFVMSFFINIEL